MRLCMLLNSCIQIYAFIHVFIFESAVSFLNGLLLLHYAREFQKKMAGNRPPLVTIQSMTRHREGRRHIVKKRIFSVPPCIRKSFVISKIMLASRKTNRRKLSASKNLALCSLISFSIYTALPLLNPFFPTLPPSTLPTVLLHCLGRF